MNDYKKKIIKTSEEEKTKRGWEIEKNVKQTNEQLWAQSSKNK